MQDKKPENLKRRGFLLAAGVGSAGAVVVAAGVGKDAAQAVTAVEVGEKADGYSETRHISNYYRTARI
jgi:hypothetical protein